MKLSDDERKLIDCLYFQADLPLREVAEKTGIKEHVARRCLDNLLTKKIISYRSLVNPYAAGLHEYMILINTPLMAPATRQLLKNVLVESPYTTYVGAVGGDYHLVAMLLARDVLEVTEILDSFRAGTRGAAFELSLATFVSVTLFKPKYLGFSEGKSSGFTYGATRSVAHLDELDHRILYALGAAPSSSTNQLAKALGVSASTISYRTQTLREKGVLVGLGLWVTLFSDGSIPIALQICAGSMPRDIKDELFNYCANHPAISFIIEALGDWNLQIGARLPDPRMVTVLADDIQRRFAPHITHISTIPMYEYLKLLPHALLGMSAFKLNQKVA